MNTSEGLRAIAQGTSQHSIKTVRIAEDLIPLLARTEVVMDDFSDSGIEQLSNKEIRALLKLIGDRLSNQ